MKLFKENRIPNFLALLLFLNIFLATFARTPIILTKGMYLLVGLASLSYTIYKKNLKQKNFFIFLFLYTIAFIVSHIYNANSDVIEILWPLGFMSIGYMLANFKINHDMVSHTFYLYLAFILFVSLTYKNVRVFSSLNGINVNILLLLSLYYITRDYCDELNQDITLVPTILSIITTMILSLNFLGGRSGTAVFLFIFILLFITRYFNGKKINFIQLIFVFIPGIFAVYQIFGEKIKETLWTLTRRGIRSIRYQIWHDYFQQTKSNIYNLLLGTKISGTRLLNGFSENLHNSFLMLHAKYGMLLLLIALLMLIITLLKYLFKKNMLYFTLFTAIVLRMFFDYTNFNATLDILLIYFIFNTHKSDRPNFYKFNKTSSRMSV